MLVELEHRSNEPELMDNPKVAQKALKIALSDISRVNKWLGGNTITIKAVHSLVEEANLSTEVLILDLGCGDGEMLRAIADSFRKKQIHAKFIGIDLNNKSLELAKKLSIKYPEIAYKKQNILELQSSTFTCDVIISTLTLHHLSCTELKGVMKKSVELASLGVVINDLQRSKIAYYLFKLFSLFFIKSYIAKHDGLVSIKRGFKKEELLRYTKELNFKQYQIDWKWAFRYCWVVKTMK